MTKRKRDIFTVIESINNWFEAGEPTTHTTEDHEGDNGNRGAIGASSDLATTNGWLEERAFPSNDPKPRPEAFQLASSHTSAIIDPSREAEVAAKSTSTPEVATRWAAGPSSVPGLGFDQGEGDREGGQSTGYLQCTENRGIGDITGPGPDPAAERELAIKAFWRVLADAGYNVW